MFRETACASRKVHDTLDGVANAFQEIIIPSTGRGGSRILGVFGGDERFFFFYDR